MAASAVIGALRVTLGLDSASFTKGLGAAQKELNRAAKSLQKTGDSLKDIGGKMSLAITAPLAAAGFAGLKMAGDFESAMNRVSIDSQAGAADMKALNDLALDLGKNTIFGATEMADAMDELAKTGMDAKTILGGAAKAAVDLATATGSELAPATTAVSDAMKQFHIEAANLPATVDQITGAVNQSKLDFNDYQLAMSQAGGVAGALGVSFTDFNTVLAGTAQLFASGSDAGTSFKTFLTFLVPQSKKAAAAMDEYGLKFFDASGKMKSMGEIAEMLRTKLGGLSDEAKTSTLHDIFGTDAMRTAVGLMDQGAAGLDKIRAGILATDAAAQSAQRMKGFNSQMEQLKGSLETLAIRVAQSGVLDAITGMVKGIADLVDRMSEANPGMLKFVAVAGTIAAALGPVIFAVGAVVQAAGSLAAVFGTVAGAGGMAALLPIIAPVAAAVAGLAAAWALFGDKIGPALSEFYAKAKAAFGPEITAIINTVKSTLSELWAGPLGEAVRHAIGVLGDFYVSYNKVLGTAFIAIVKTMLHVVSETFAQIGDAIKLVSRLLSGDWKGAWESAKAIVNRAFGGLPAYVAGVMRDMVAAVKLWLGKPLTDAMNAALHPIETVKKAFHGLMDAVVGHSYIPDMVDGVHHWMGRPLRTALEQAFPPISDVEDAFGDLPDTIDKSLKDVAPAIDDGLVKPAEDAKVEVINSFAQMASGVINSLQGLAQSIKKGDIFGIITGVLDTISGIAGGTKNGFNIGPLSFPGQSSGGFEGFAGGGSFRVGGTAGIDSNLVQFKATRGEMVDIWRPGDGPSRGGGGNTVHNHFSGNLLTPEFWAQINSGHDNAARRGADLALTRAMRGRQRGLAG